MNHSNSRYKIKNIVFDLGNTLVFFDYDRFFDGLSELEENTNKDKLKKFFSESDIDLKIGSCKLTIKEAYELLKKEFNLKTGYRKFLFLYCDIFQENTKMKDFLEIEMLDSNYNLYMLSNVDASHINFVNKNYPYVNHIKKRVLSYKVKAVKPDKKIYKHLIKKYKLEPKESLFIDDLKANIEESRSHGLNAIHYTSHDKFLKEFKKYTDEK